MSINYNFSTNTTLMTLDLTDPIITITTWSTSILAYLLALIVVIMSRSNLNRIEIYILIVICLSNSISKLCYLISYFVSFFQWRISGPCFAFTFGALFFVFDFICCSTLFQYSLFQISSLSRAKLFLRLFDTFHSMRGFIIYQIVATILAISLNLIQWWDKFLSGCNYLQQSDYIIIFYLVFFGPRVFVVSSYLLATCYVFFTRFRPRTATVKYSSNNQSDMKRYQRNLNLILKFNLLSILFIISYLPLMLVYFVDASIVMTASFSVNKIFMVYIPLLVYVIHPLLLIYVHNILKATFKRVLLRRS